MSQVPGFGFPKLLTRKEHGLSILRDSEIYGLQEQMNVLYKFFENAKAKERTTFAPLSQAEYVASVQR